MPWQNQLIIGLIVVMTCVSCVEADLVAFELALEDSAGNPINSIAVGETFELVVSAQDIRDTPEGVFSAYLDILYSGSLVSPVSIVHSSNFPNATFGQLSQSGIVDEAGGITGLTPTGGALLELLTVVFQAEAAGTASFQSDPADQLPQHATTVVGSNDLISDIRYGIASLQITAVPEPSAFLLVSLCWFGLSLVRAHPRWCGRSRRR